MGKNVENVINILKEKNIEINNNAIATGLRLKLGNETVEKIYYALANSLYDNEKEYPEEFDKNDYEYYWLATKLIEMDESELNEDGLKYPSHQWIDDDMYYPISLITKQLNRLDGIKCYDGVIYKDGSCYKSKGIWRIVFDTVEDFNHFLWAGCYRYMSLSRSTDWLLLPSLGDPNYNEKKLKIDLHYMNLGAKKEQIEKDITAFAKCIENYANEEKDIKKNLLKEE